MADTTREHQLEALIVDLTAQGLRSCEDIQSATGLSDERCLEMQALIQEVWDTYYGRNAPGCVESERVATEFALYRKRST